MTLRTTLPIFLLSLVIFGVIHAAAPGFGDPDAYYHLEAAKLTAASGPIRAFDWLPFTTLAHQYADQHFLYHAALIPFIKFFGDFFGLKIATVAFAALAMAAFAWMLKTYGVRHSQAWTLPLLFAPGFLFRVLLTKATGLALAAFFIFLGLLKTKRPAALFFSAFAYVWLHASWPILGIAAFVHAIFHRDRRPFLIVAAGLAAGFVLNPFFPANFAFNWEQIVQIAVIGARDPGIQVGNEWSPVEIGWLLVENMMVFLAIGGAFVWLAFLVYRQEHPPEVSPARRRDIVFLMSLAIFFLCLTLRQARHKEYFLPLALATGALLGDAVDFEPRAMLARFRAWSGRWFRPSAAFAAVLICFAGFCGVWYARELYARRTPFARYAAAGAWMREHIPKRAVVFHAAWDDFPYLFYRDPAQRYIAGMDPMFFYRNDPDLYWLWRDIGEGRRRDFAALIRERFRADYVFVNPKRDKMAAIIKKDPSFERIYSDDEAEIWKIK